MSEQIRIKYRRLFEVKVLHHYWLDEGETLFDSIDDPLKKQQRLSSYDVRAFLEIRPTSKTEKQLEAYRAIVINSALGLIAAVPEEAIIASDALFEFAVIVRNPVFINYTALMLRRQRIMDLYDADLGKRYLYKENVPVLSNLTGASRGSGDDEVLFLSKEFPAVANDDLVEAMGLSGNSLTQLIADQPGDRLHTITDQAGLWPVYVHQGDVPVLEVPEMEGAIFRGIALDSSLPKDVFALIRLHAERLDDGRFSLIDSQGRAKQASPSFHVRLKNRSTFWQYLNQDNGSLEFETAEPLPSTYFGNAGNRRKPSENSVKPVLSGDRVIKLVSEIYE
ncbi:hypothetical protein [Methylotuvimicrobium sp. KM1]|uniref:hypothetical protein n=1 Tax=Methylotuvimicrobium sp. KM1 TaxID=3377707 RepID=UPI00385124D7